MKKTYSFENSQLVLSSPGREAQVIVYSKPNDAERDELIKDFSLESFDFDAICDPDEVPRLEISADSVLVIWKSPDNVSSKETIEFNVSSVGFILRKDKLVVILPKGEIPFDGREFRRLNNLLDVFLRLFIYTIRRYQGHLKAIKIISAELQSKIVSSMENKYLLQMFTLGESLVYYLNALETNSTILMRLRALTERLNFTPEQTNFLDDIIIENQQAVKQASIYSNVLSGLMDARGTIINNNMNILLKNLTLINVVFLPLNLIASMLGMSEFSMMTEGIDWKLSYTIFSLAMVIIGWLTWWWLVNIVERKQIK